MKNGKKMFLLCFDCFENSKFHRKSAYKFRCCRIPTLLFLYLSLILSASIVGFLFVFDAFYVVVFFLCFIGIYFSTFYLNLKPRNFRRRTKNRWSFAQTSKHHVIHPPMSKLLNGFPWASAILHFIACLSSFLHLPFGVLNVICSLHSLQT